MSVFGRALRRVGRHHTFWLHPRAFGHALGAASEAHQQDGGHEERPLHESVATFGSSSCTDGHAHNPQHKARHEDEGGVPHQPEVEQTGRTVVGLGHSTNRSHSLTLGAGGCQGLVVCATTARMEPCACNFDLMQTRRHGRGPAPIRARARPCRCCGVPRCARGLGSRRPGGRTSRRAGAPIRTRRPRAPAPSSRGACRPRPTCVRG